MNSNPYTVPAFIAAAAVLFGCGAWAFLAITRQPPAGRHARIPGPSLEGARFAAELQGQPEPQEEQPAPGSPDEQYGPGDDDWWEHQPPQPPAVGILTGPGTSIRQTSAVTISTLAKVRDALMPDAWKPDEPGEVTWTPADPDATLTDLRAVPAADAPQYLAAPQ